MPRLSRTTIINRRHPRRHPLHVHVFDRIKVVEDYLGVGATFPACECGVIAPVPARGDA